LNELANLWLNHYMLNANCNINSHPTERT
jgi:hypothetical protein